ncbi:MAG: IS630 family transposase [Rhodoferax sp.]|nr:IS630 family transposase [Rhodoferax sp.]MCF8208551.1 IS630 family transposase [Rhodoferax sp.]
MSILADRKLTRSEVFSELGVKGFNVPYSTFSRYCRNNKIDFSSNTNSRNSKIISLQDLFHGKNVPQYFSNELLSSEETKILLGKIKKGSLRDRKRACTILAREYGLPNRTIASALNSSPSTTREYYISYKNLGISTLFTSNRAKNNDSTKDANRTNRIIELLHQRPSGFGINRTSWSQISIGAAYETQFDEKISRSTIARSLKELRFTWMKAKKILTSPDPNYREKVELLLSKLQTLAHDEQFFFLDELGPLLVKKRGGRTYVLNGTVPNTPRRQISKGSVTLLGALSATTNQVTWIFGESKDSGFIIDLIEILFNQYYDKKAIFITWDAVSWHKSVELMTWLDSFNDTTKKLGKGPVIEIVPLPTSSQFLNVIEGVFSGMMRAVVHNSDYQSEQEMKIAMSRHLCERNSFFVTNPKRVGKRIWETDFFRDNDNLRFGNYFG